LLSDIDNSLKALRTDYIDLYYLHRDNTKLGVEDIIGWMNEFVAASKIRFFGSSNWKTERIREAQRYAKVSGQMGFCANQPLWNVGCYTMTAQADPTMVVMDKKMIQFHMETRLAVVPYSSQADGFFQNLTVVIS
jgi:aryl-alcohol dehydrogenase-like predicted oxidoreductase